MNNSESVKRILTAAAAGDAAGYTLEGMKSGHIKAVFKDSPGFPDPGEGLKGNMNRWRKPGLYSSITQIMLLSCAFMSGRYMDRAGLIKAAASAPELPDLDYSYFRNPGAPEKNFLSRAGEKKENMPETRFERPCARVIPLSIPFLLFTGDSRSLAGELIRFITLFTSSPRTAASSSVFLFLLRSLLSDKSPGIMGSALSSAEETMNLLSECRGLIFDTGINPDYILRESEDTAALIRKLRDCEDTGMHENIICTHINSSLKSPVTRASVNDPLSILAYAISLASAAGREGDVFHAASREGGSSSALAAAAGAISTAWTGNDIPEIYQKGLINRKRILAMTDMAVQEGNRQKIPAELLDGEPALTLKEREEYLARNKKTTSGKKPAKPKTRKEAEAELSRHVVESWTKADKAKWKKERKKNKS